MVVFCGIKFVQFGQNLAKSGQTREKDSQHRCLRFHSNSTFNYIPNLMLN
jgi:hypothetical protein